MGDTESRPATEVGSVVVSTFGPDGAWVDTAHYLAEFEQSEHGAVFGRLVVPWPRVERITWSLPPREAEIDQPHSVVRVVIEDGSIEGEELVVASERFDVTPWAAGLLIDDLVDANRGLVSQRRILVPWHAVREYERTTASVLQGGPLTPSRPDAQL
ncbi:MAG TPA: hypothetical protein VJ736_12400 [Actinomycetota bacterium]|jgi:hypothetical protein|nr:hypothetical protein [Actinomycetota bacterium]